MTQNNCTPGPAEVTGGEGFEGTFNALFPCPQSVCRTRVEVIGETGAFAGAEYIDPDGEPQTVPAGGQQIRVILGSSSVPDRVVWVASQFARLGMHLSPRRECGILAFDHTRSGEGWTQSVEMYYRETSTGRDSRLGWSVPIEDIIPDATDFSGVLTPPPNATENYPGCDGTRSFAYTDPLNAFVTYVGPEHNGMVPVCGWVRAFGTDGDDNYDPEDPATYGPYYHGWGIAFCRMVSVSNGAPGQVVAGWAGGYYGGVYHNATCEGTPTADDPLYTDGATFTSFWGYYAGYWLTNYNQRRWRAHGDISVTGAVALSSLGYNSSLEAFNFFSTRKSEFGAAKSCGYGAYAYSGVPTAPSFGACWYEWTNETAWRSLQVNQSGCARMAEEWGSSRLWLPLEKLSGGTSVPDPPQYRLCNVGRVPDLESTASSVVRDENGNEIGVQGGWWNFACGILYGIGVTLVNTEDESQLANTAGLLNGRWIVRHDPATKETRYIPADGRLTEKQFLGNPFGPYSVFWDPYVLRDFSSEGIQTQEDEEFGFDEECFRPCPPLQEIPRGDDNPDPCCRAIFEGQIVPTIDIVIDPPNFATPNNCINFTGSNCTQDDFIANSPTGKACAIVFVTATLYDPEDPAGCDEDCGLTLTDYDVRCTNQLQGTSITVCGAQVVSTQESPPGSGCVKQVRWAIYLLLEGQQYVGDDFFTFCLDINVRVTVRSENCVESLSADLEIG